MSLVKQPSDNTYVKVGSTVFAPVFTSDINEAKEFATQGEADGFATRINAGTLGVPKP